MINCNVNPVCITTAIECSPLPAPQNGQIRYSSISAGNHSIGTEAMYECFQNFSLNGSEAVRTCEADDQADAVGVWSGDTPICERKLLSTRSNNMYYYYCYLIVLCPA